MRQGLLISRAYLWARGLVCGLVLVACACATAPTSRPVAPPSPNHPELTVVKTQAFVPAGELTVPAPVSPATPWTMSGPVPLLPVPESGWTDESGRPALREVPKQEASPEGQVPKPSPPTPELKPASPLIVKPEPPQVPEREPEKAGRRSTEKPRRPNEVFINEDDWKPVKGEPRYRPCIWKGTGGGAPGKDSSLPPVWLRCTYQCGRYEVILRDVRGKSEDECNTYSRLKRAESEARNFDDGLKAKGR